MYITQGCGNNAREKVGRILEESTCTDNQTMTLAVRLYLKDSNSLKTLFKVTI